MSHDHSSREVRTAGEEPSGEALRGAFRAALNARQPSDVDRLREAACEYVRALRERGESPESVVVAVKDVLRRASNGQTPTHDSRREADTLVERVVTWCISEYYRSVHGDEL